MLSVWDTLVIPWLTGKILAIANCIPTIASNEDHGDIPQLHNLNMGA